MLGVSFLFMVGLFIAAPHLLTLGRSSCWAATRASRGCSSTSWTACSGSRSSSGWLALVARTKDAQRLFQYHGAEHKAIWTYESRLPLTVENARGFTTQHPRCGTSFLFVVVGVAVLLHIVRASVRPHRLQRGRRYRRCSCSGSRSCWRSRSPASPTSCRSARPATDCPPVLRALVSPGIVAAANHHGGAHRRAAGDRAARARSGAGARGGSTARRGRRAGVPGLLGRRRSLSRGAACSRARCTGL